MGGAAFGGGAFGGAAWTSGAAMSGAGDDPLQRVALARRGSAGVAGRGSRFGAGGLELGLGARGAARQRPDCQQPDDGELLLRLMANVSRSNRRAHRPRRERPSTIQHLKDERRRERASRSQREVAGGTDFSLAFADMPIDAQLNDLLKEAMRTKDGRTSRLHPDDQDQAHGAPHRGWLQGAARRRALAGRDRRLSKAAPQIARRVRGDRRAGRRGDLPDRLRDRVLRAISPQGRLGRRDARDRPRGRWSGWASRIRSRPAASSARS